MKTKRKTTLKKKVDLMRLGFPRYYTKEMRKDYWKKTTAKDKQNMIEIYNMKRELKLKAINKKLKALNKIIKKK